MLIRVLRENLAPYKTQLGLVVLLQFVGTMAALFLPSLNADIIDNGVARGDTGYIVSTGGGDIRIRRAAGHVEAMTGGGDVSIDIENLGENRIFPRDRRNAGWPLS